jgi:hypothetical protein
LRSLTEPTHRHPAKGSNDAISVFLGENAMAQNKENAKSNRPDFEVFVVVETSKEKAIWTRIGAAWSHDDSEGFTITLHAVPVDGRLVVRKIKSDKSDNE